MHRELVRCFAGLAVRNRLPTPCIANATLRSQTVLALARTANRVQSSRCAKHVGARRDSSIPGMVSLRHARRATRAANKPTW